MSKIYQIPEDKLLQLLQYEAYFHIVDPFLDQIDVLDEYQIVLNEWLYDYASKVNPSLSEYEKDKFSLSDVAYNEIKKYPFQLSAANQLNPIGMS